MENKYFTGGYVGGGGLLAWLGSIDLASWSYIVGITIGVLGFVFGVWWQWKKDRRDEAIMKATLEALRTRGVIIHDDHPTVG